MQLAYYIKISGTLCCLNRAEYTLKRAVYTLKRAACTLKRALHVLLRDLPMRHGAVHDKLRAVTLYCIVDTIRRGMYAPKRAVHTPNIYTPVYTRAYIQHSHINTQKTCMYTQKSLTLLRCLSSECLYGSVECLQVYIRLFWVYARLF